MRHRIFAEQTHVTYAHFIPKAVNTLTLNNSFGPKTNMLSHL